MFSTETLQTANDKRRDPARRGGRARMLAIPAMLLSLTVGGAALTATANAAEGCQGGPNQGAPSCAGSSSNNKGKAKVEGDYQHPKKLTPGKKPERTKGYWEQLGWPNWRGIGDRDASWQVASWTDPSTAKKHIEWVETGGRYWDNGHSLRDFMNSGGAGPSSRNYQGTFQEYNADTFDHRLREGEATGNSRFVRAINTGDLWVTYNHYKSFLYLGKG
ncbi:hypothetical protein [Streptomyces sp. NPDC054940]